MSDGNGLTSLLYILGFAYHHYHTVCLLHRDYYPNILDGISLGYGGNAAYLFLIFSLCGQHKGSDSPFKVTNAY